MTDQDIAEVNPPPPGENPLEATEPLPGAEGSTLGPILETLSARITVRYPVERTEDDEAAAKAIDLTNDTIAEVVKVAIENHIDLTGPDGADDFTVGVRVEKV